jgi:uncharacterized membrane protein (UPF0127 family)
MSAFLNPLLDAPAEAHHIVNVRSGGTPVAITVRCAFDSSTRNTGLLGRNALAGGEALIIAPCQAIHTWFMRFPIDVAFVNKRGLVVSVRHRVRPWRIAIALRAFAVIELAAGTLEQTGTIAGDTLAIVAG